MKVWALCVLSDIFREMVLVYFLLHILPYCYNHKQPTCVTFPLLLYILIYSLSIPYMYIYI